MTTPDRRLLPTAWWSLAGLAWVSSTMVPAVLIRHLHQTGSGGLVDSATLVVLAAAAALDVAARSRAGA